MNDRIDLSEINQMIEYHELKKQEFKEQLETEMKLKGHESDFTENEISELFSKHEIDRLSREIIQIKAKMK